MEEKKPYSGIKKTKKEKGFPDCPAWLRITDDESKSVSNRGGRYHGKVLIPWNEEIEELVLRMREDKKTYREIAEKLTDILKKEINENVICGYINRNFEGI